MTSFKKNIEGFTLAETIVAMLVATTIILLVLSIHQLARSIYDVQLDAAERIQNGRVVLDRLTREIRQTPEIVTSLPEAPNNPLNPPPTDILFQDGHTLTPITYIRYKLINSTITHQSVAYEFSAFPGDYVFWNTVDQFGNPPNEVLLNEEIIGEWFQTINYSGTDIIQVHAELLRTDEQTTLETKIYGRNL